MTETDSASETSPTEPPQPIEAAGVEASSAAPSAPGEPNPSPAPSSPQKKTRGPLDRLGLWLFGLATSAILRMLGATWRIETIGLDPQRPGVGGRPQLAALFHESMLPCAWLYRDRRYSVAVSRSRDGDLIAATLMALGYAEPARGSSSRGGSSVLRQLVRQIATGTTTAVLVDGPRGPARVSKTGIVSLARLADRPIQPIAFSARPAIRLSSWDQSLIPLPFARVVVAYGEPIEVPAGAEPDETTEIALARRLDRRLSDLHHAADGLLLGR